jgi:hypothetical protein
MSYPFRSYGGAMSGGRGKKLSQSEKNRRARERRMQKKMMQEMERGPLRLMDVPPEYIPYKKTCRGPLVPDKRGKRMICKSGFEPYHCVARQGRKCYQYANGPNPNPRRRQSINRSSKQAAKSNPWLNWLRVNRYRFQNLKQASAAYKQEKGSSREIVPYAYNPQYYEYEGVQ